MKSLVVAFVLAALVIMPKPSQAQTAPLGPGWYFVSICGLYGEATQWCWFGQAAYFFGGNTEPECTATLTSLINSGSILVTWPYAPSNCFYMN